ncbi:MAG: DUF1223 domain-containing protein [Burkholderiaceae bacterium]
MKLERHGIRKGFLALALASQALPAFAACQADSGTIRAALVELYTSEGCSSCPPADKELGKLTQRGPRVIPLALHVDYWDSIGWKDRFAQKSFTRRQEWEVQANRHRTSFTPHFFVNGKEVQDWRADLDASLRPVAALPVARIAITAEPHGSTALRLKVDGSVMAGGQPHGPLQLFVVVTEGGLSTQVGAGENRGVKLEHDAVARNWFGPISVQGGMTSFDQVVDIPQLAAGQVGVVSFIQDATTAEVLQAVETGACKTG